MLTWFVANALLGGGILTLGCLLAGLSKSPARRLRLLEWILIAALGAPILVHWHGPWAYRLPWLPAASATPVADDAPTLPTPDSRIPSPPGLAPTTKQQIENPRATVAPLAPNTPAQSWTWPEWRQVALATQGAAVLLLVAWWLLGLIALARMWSTAQPADAPLAARIDNALPLDLRRSMFVRVHPRASTPCVFGILQPCILLPDALTRKDQRQQLQFALTHEASHWSRGDLWSWRLVRLAQFAFWFQPAYWWLRRQARLCQDYLADSDASRTGEPVDLAQFLVEFARSQQTLPALAALSMRSRPKDLTRRIAMLLQSPASLERRCPRSIQASAALAVITILAAAAVVRLEAQESPQNAKPDKKVEAALKAPPAQNAAAPEPLTYHCRVLEYGTNAPLANATVVVKRSLLGDPRFERNKEIEVTTYTTDADGAYTVTLPPEQAGEKYLYIELDVTHPSHAPRTGFGYALSMIRKNEKIGERPFFETVRLHPAVAVTGTVVLPDGSPAANTKITGFTYPGKVRMPHDDEMRGSFEESTTDDQGKFRLLVASPGKAAFWLKPENAAPLGFVAPAKGGDVGTLKLQPGLRTKGRVLDSNGKPLAGMAITVSRRDAESPEVDQFNRTSYAMGGYVRGATTDEEGRFQLPPVGQATYEFRVEADRNVERQPVYAGAFMVQFLPVTQDDQSIELKALPTVDIRVKNVDAEGAPVRGFEFFVFGKLDGGGWYTAQSDRPDNGQSTARVPKGLKDLQIQFMANEHGSFRVRRAPGEEPQDSHELKIERIDADLEGIEVIRYKAPIILVKAVDADQKLIPDYKATITYGPPGKDEGGVGLEKQQDGRWRTTQLLPDEDLTVAVNAAGWKAESQAVKLTEGEVRELVFTMARE